MNPITTSNLRNRFRSALVCAVVTGALAFPSFVHAQFQYTGYGEALAGFRQAGGTNELVANLGSITNLEMQAAGTTITITNFAVSNLAAAFPSNFNNLSWSVSAAVPGAFGTWAGYPVATIWYTQARTNVSAPSDVPNRASSSTQGGYRQNMLGAGNGAVALSTSQSNAYNTAFVTIEPAWDGVSLSRNEYTYFVDNTGFGPTGSYGLPNKVEKTTPTNFVSAVRADLYRSRPTGFSDPDTGSSSGAAYFVGYFQLNPDGTMTFTRAAATLVADAGADATVCLGSSTVIGGSPTGSGGYGTLTYGWSPTNGLSDATVANPTATPTSPTTYTVTVTDSEGSMVSDSVQVAISAVVVGPGTLPNGAQDSNYSQVVSASGGTAPYTFSVITGSLPGGLTLASGGLLSGIPTAAGLFNFTVSATDMGGCFNTQAYSVAIAANTNYAGQGTNFQFTQQFGNVLAGFRKAGVSNEFVANLGNITNLENMALGTTVTLSNFAPSQLAAVFPNGFGGLNWSASASFPGAFGTWDGFPVTTVWYTQPRTNVSVPSAAPNRASSSTQGGYRQNMLGVGNGAATLSASQTNAYNTTYVAVEPAWDGVSLSRNEYTYFVDNTGFGPIGSYGLPNVVEKTTPTNFLSAVRADLYRSRPTGFSDPDTSSSSGPAYLVGYFQLNPSGTMTFTRAAAALVANAGSNAVVCLGSSTVIGGSPTGSGGYGALTYAWSPTNGLSDATVANPTATPTSTTTYTVTVMDSEGSTASGSVQVAVSAVVVSPGTLPNGAQDSSYSQTISASGGAAPYTFSVITGSLPGGLTLASGGLLSGIPTGAGVFNFTVAAADMGGCFNTQAYSLAIAANTNYAGQGTNFQFTQQFGNLLAGFRKTGVTNELVANLGSVTNLEALSIGTSVTISNFAPSQLAAAFPGGLGNLSWSVSASFPGAFGSWAGFPVTTVWFTQPRTNTSVQSTAPNRASSSTQSGYRQNMLGVGNGAATLSTSQTNAFSTAYLTFEPAWDGVSLSRNEYTYFVDNTGFGPIGSYGLPNVAEKTTPPTFNASVRADLYRSRPTGFADPDTGGSSGPAFFLGYFELNPDGTMTFTRAAAVVPPPPPAPTIVSITRAGNTSTVSFTTTNGAIYSLYYNNAAGLGQPVTTWPVVGTTVVGDGAVDQLSDTSTDPNRVYRVGAH